MTFVPDTREMNVKGQGDRKGQNQVIRAKLGLYMLQPTAHLRPGLVSPFSQRGNGSEEHPASGAQVQE